MSQKMDIARLNQAVNELKNRLRRVENSGGVVGFDLSAMTLSNHGANDLTFDEENATQDDIVAALGTIIQQLGGTVV